MRRPEQALQRTIVEWLHYALPDDVWFTAVNPSPAKSKAVAGVSKAMGLKPGVPDLIFCIHGRFVGIELKAGKGKPSDAQDECHRAINVAGGWTYVATSIEMLTAHLEAQGVDLKAT